jgi:hypothetical protein
MKQTKLPSKSTFVKTLSINFILKCNDNCKDRNQCFLRLPTKKKKKKKERKPSDRLSSIKTINLMNLKRIKGRNTCRARIESTKKEMKLFIWRALRFQLIRNYVILIDLIRLTSYLTLIFRRPNYISICFRCFCFRVALRSEGT